RLLDLDDLRAVVAEDLRGQWPGHDAGEIEDAHAFERAGHQAPPDDRAREDYARRRGRLTRRAPRYTPYMRPLAALGLAVALAGCSVISIDLTPRIRPLEEQTVEGRGEAKVLLMDVSGFISDEGSGPILTIGAEPPRVPMLVRIRDKLGVSTSAIKSGPRKDMGSPFRQLTDDERTIFQSVIDELQVQFVKKVAEQRGMPIDRARHLADGRIYTAEQALANHLVDQVGYMDDAILAAKHAAGVDRARVI